ncbi:ABC transporter ATP-binding protein [Virgibacillus xinjiangensis]|uniref:ABC transporter ATP-binding protein n=1 Tax=Virgibacillus xinjiangensis TaxID=393090 RepID=A0ABV7CY39_9BACI
MSIDVALSNVSWKREGKMILSEIDWEVKSGEHWAVLGLNGSGKTTLLNMINGYIWPTNGTVQVLGNLFGKTDIRELRKSIGWVSSSLQERIRGTELGVNVVLSGKYASIGLYEHPGDEEYHKAYQLMEQLDCAELAENPYQSCSQGEKQKLLIARGLMGDPKLLILDEPTTGLDFLAREDLLESVSRMASEKGAPTIIFVTHHTEEILPVFSHTLLLRGGKVFDQGQTERVLTSGNLSAFLHEEVEVEWQRNRPWMLLKEKVKE